MKPIKQRIADMHRESEALDIDDGDARHMHDVALRVASICAMATEFGARPGGKHILDAVMVLSAALAVMAGGGARARPGDDDVVNELAVSCAAGEEIGKMLLDAGVIQPVERCGLVGSSVGRIMMGVR